MRKYFKSKGKDYFVHESSYIDEPVEIGGGTKIWHFTHVMKNAKIGKNCNIGQNCFIGSKVVIGDNCKIQNNVSIYEGVTLENGVFCGPSCVFSNVINPRAFLQKMNELQPTLVKEGATIGANATIVCGNNIGRYSMVGAGSIVTHDVPDFHLVVGCPARATGIVCLCGNILKANAEGSEIHCEKCGSTLYLELVEDEKEEND